MFDISNLHSLSSLILQSLYTVNGSFKEWLLVLHAFRMDTLCYMPEEP